MKRRQVLGLTGGMGCSILAGCTGSSDDDSGSSVQDSDGDGVVDSEDYAPNDPDVQEKSDLQSKTTATKRSSSGSGTTQATATASSPATATQTATPTTTITTSTTATSTTAKPDPNELEVESDFFEGDSHIVSYTSEEVTAVIDPNDPNLNDVDLTAFDVAIATAEFPRLENVNQSVNRSDLRPDSKTTVSVPIDLGDAPTETPLHHYVFLVPSGETLESVDSSAVFHLHESDPFVVESDGVTISRAAVPELAALTDDSGDHHDRTIVEGAINLEITGRTLDTDWSSSFYVFKSYYAEVVRRDHGRDRAELVGHEMDDGFAGEVAAFLKEDAKASGLETTREQAGMAIDFVQYLPYVPDDVSEGYDDYTKFVVETLTEFGGDCEDTSILLAAVLQSSPFGYDTVLIQPPDHMAVGIKGSDDVSGVYWEHDGNKYFYQETTSTGWGLGDIPEEYEDAEAYVYQV